MRRFRSAGHAQRILSSHSLIHNHFQVRRQLTSAFEYRAAHSCALITWGVDAGLAQVG
ncbi:hypothetical protein [Indioceanicola profundi]|uniref:hypothetical protein n=1 Tax=Indioceanicola profundi TaxID=2220096 RepID=UPI0013C4B1E3|nr:hypothetical protein [Indioceanicola profundi]